MARILLIDDDEMVRSALQTFLAHAGHVVVEAADGRAGLRIQETEPCDLIITDIVMPDQDGVGLIMALRKAEYQVPIIAMSGGLANSESYLGLAKRLGARRILAKPFRLTELSEAVNEALGGAG
jgi:DNA-binding response OmpR family regulator